MVTKIGFSCSGLKVKFVDSYPVLSRFNSLVLHRGWLRFSEVQGLLVEGLRVQLRV